MRLRRLSIGLKTQAREKERKKRRKTGFDAKYIILKLDNSSHRTIHFSAYKFLALSQK